MDFLVGCASSIAANFVDSTIGVVARRLFPYRRDIDNLTAGIRDLSKARETVEEEVKKARDEGLVIHADVEEWRSSAGVIYERAQAFRDSSRDRANISCCTLRIPNLASRRGLSREARQLLAELEREIEAGRFDSVASRPAMHKGIEIRGDYEHFESREAILEGIMTALQDREVTKIGVYGMCGIGKTMLTKEVARRATEAKLFAEVAVTTISQTPDPRRLQKEIAEKIHLDFKGDESIPARADRLQRRLREEKSILIILDDIWERLYLLEVGIHFEHHGCKILMTSRSLDVVRSMGVEKTVKVSSISDEEAMNLFQRIVGGIVERPDFKGLATDVVGECGGLPLAITTVASTLIDQDSLDVWRDTLTRLRSIISPTNIDEPLREVYRSIRLSYDSLSDEQKSLLLLCSLHREDSNIYIEDLIMIGVGWGLFQDVRTLSDARTRAHSLVVRLKARCLLLDGYAFGCDAVRMHDVIRDVALSIASEERGMHSIVIDKLKDCLNEKNLKDSKVISLLRYERSDTQLPERLDCPQLESLFFVSDGFRWMERSVPIPKHFFEKSKHHLKSLLFCGAELVPIPPSLHSLQNLQTLCLRGCVLEDVSFIGDLKSLIILDLSHSTIKQLPIEVGQLNRLQLLNLEGCKALELIEPNVISSLTRLEELHITVNIRSNANLAELMNLPQLTSLSLEVSHSKTFPKHFMFRKELEQYRIFIGGSKLFDRDSSQLSGITRSLQLKLEERSQLKELGLESLVKRSEALSLDGLAGVKNVVCDLDNEGFPMLEILCLEELTNLERICQGKLPQDSFNKLREVYVRNCDKLKNLFPLSIAKRLQKIEVSGCDMMEEVVGHGTENDANIISDEATHHVVELRSLTLKSLPKFVQFINWSESEATCGSPSVQSPIPLFCEKLEFPSLEDLTLSGINVQILWLDFQLRTTPFMDNLTILRVSACNNLKYLFPFFIAERLVKLEKLIVSDCEVMEDIVVMKNLEEEERLGKILFPKLEGLTLYKLPALRNFCVGDCIKFESLSGLTIKECPQLKTFLTCSTPILEVSVDNEEGNHSAITQPLFNEKLEFPSLEYLILSGINVQILWLDFQLRTTSYMDNLTILDVSECNNLKYLFPFFIVERLVKLETLVVSCCELMEDIVVMKNLEEEGRLGKILFPNLTHLTLDKLPALRNVCVGDCIKFESLSTLTIEHCPQLETFFSCSTPILEVSVDNEEEGRLGKILFPKLEVLKLAKLPALRNFCVGDCIKFESLSYISIGQCPQLETFLSCSTPILEVSVDNEEGNHLAITQPFFNEKLEFPRLEDLTLSEINVQILWLDFQLRTTSYMDNLTSLDVSACNNLKYLFPFFIAERLVKLEMLHVRNCEVMEDIVVMKNLEEEGMLGKILFPKLKYLKLDNLPALRNFCVGDCIKFESLSKLVIRECPQLKTFLTCSTPILEVSVDNEEGNHSAITQPFFNEKVIMPVLKYLETDWSNAMNEQLNMSQSSSTVLVLPLSNQLKELKLNCSTRDKPIALPIFDLLRRYQNLEKLTLKGFFVTSAQEYDGQLVANLTMLKLDNVPKLRYLFGESENAQPANLFACFQNLTILEVSFCHRLTYLLASTIATSLVQLEQMRITNCNRISTIIEDYRENETTKREHDHEFVFPKLEILELESLPHLESFYSGNTDIRLPKLVELFVSRCREMRTFSSGNISAPMLHKITYEWRSQSLDGDVNTTVRKLWEDDSNLTLQQFTETEVHDSREGTSSRAARL